MEQNQTDTPLTPIESTSGQYVSLENYFIPVEMTLDEWLDALPDDYALSVNTGGTIEEAILQKMQPVDLIWPEGADVNTDDDTPDTIDELLGTLYVMEQAIDPETPRHAKQRAKRKKDLHKRAVERRRKRKNGGKK